MSLFNRLFGGKKSVTKSTSSSNTKEQKDSESFFLDSDTSTGLGNVDFMRRSNKIRHTFPGNRDNPGNKEMIMDVASMEAKLEKISDKLGGASTKQSMIKLNDGIPNAPKKSFPDKMNAAQLTQKLRGSGLTGVNVPLSSPPAARKSTQKSEEESRNASNKSQSGVKPGSTDPFKNMAKELNN